MRAGGDVYGEIVGGDEGEGGVFSGVRLYIVYGELRYLSKDVELMVVEDGAGYACVFDQCDVPCARWIC